MNKTELIANMADVADISKAAADRALLGFLEAVTDSLLGYFNRLAQSASQSSAKSLTV